MYIKNIKHFAEKSFNAFNSVWGRPIKHTKTFFSAKCFIIFTFYMDNVFYIISRIFFCDCSCQSRWFVTVRYFNICVTRKFSWWNPKQGFQTWKNSKKPQEFKNSLQKNSEWFSMTTIDSSCFMKMLWSISAHLCFQKKYWFRTGFVVFWYTSILNEYKKKKLCSLQASCRHAAGQADIQPLVWKKVYIGVK